MPFHSFGMSSQTWRENLLFASIASVFDKSSKKGEQSPPRSSTTMESEDGAASRARDNSTATREKSFGMASTIRNSTTEVKNGKMSVVDGVNDIPPTKQEPVPNAMHSDPFAGGIEGGIQYQTMKWWQAGMVMVAETISLGILALPAAMATLGLIPGLILLVGLGFMATYSGYVIGQFKIAHPHIHSFADAGEVLFGRFGRELLGTGQLLFFIFIMGSHILTFAVMMNAITNNGACKVLFSAVGMILSLALTMPRTLRNVSYYSIASFISIIGAVMIVMIGVGVTQPGMNEYRLWPAPNTQFYQAFLAATNIIFAYAGHAAFFTFISELKDPQDFPKALAFLQVSDVSMYIITAVVVYYYAGNDVASPALDSVPSLLRKLAWGIAIPTIVIAGVVNAHVAVKYLYVRLLRNHSEDIMHQRGHKAIGIWVFICTTSWIVAWLIAEAIPVFSDLLGITSALFASWFTFGLSGMFWLHMNFEKGDRWYKIEFKHSWTWKKIVLLLLNLGNILAGAIVCFAGLYATAKSIQLNSITQKPFSCHPKTA